MTKVLAAILDSRSTLLLLSLLGMTGIVGAQGTEDFSDLPTTNPGSYQSRSWTGTDGVTWTAEEARTDQTLNGKAICFGPTGIRRVTSPSYANGMGTLTFNYVRGFTNSATRTLQVWVNGLQIGSDITVDPNSNTHVGYSHIINIPGNVMLEIRSTTAGQVIVDDISWNAFAGGPVISFTSTSSASPEANGDIPVDLTIAPAATQADTVTIVLSGSATFGSLPDDYTTSPDTVSADTISLPVSVGDTALSFTLHVNDDAVIEPDEEVVCTITGVTGGLSLGSTAVHTHTIVDDDAPVLEPGDIVVVGMATTVNGCTGSSDDEISFFCFKDIPSGTSIDLSDCGYESATGLWHTTNDGLFRITRTGTTLAAGTVITLRVANSTGLVTFVAPDVNWSAFYFGPYHFNLGGNGEQFFFLQGGTDWNGSSTTTAYNGRVLSALSYHSSPAWAFNAGSQSTSSDLPPDVACLGIDLPANSNYYKYTGDTSIVSRKDWLLRVLNNSNWTAYGTSAPDCIDYHDPALGYDWLAAGFPKLRIAGGTTVNAWNGSVSTDWFDCSNWDGRFIPLATTNVSITDGALNDCEVYNGDTAVCASLALTSTSSTVRNLGLINGSDLAIGGPITITHGSGTGQLKATVGEGSVLTADTVSITGNTASGAEAALLCDSMGSTLNVIGDLTIGTGGLLDLQGADASHSGVLFLGGNYSNAGDETHFLDSLSLVTFNGSSDQTVDIGTAPEYFHDLTVNKPDGSLLLNDSITVRNVLDLTHGVVYDTLPNTMVTLLATASAINTSDAGYVGGPVKKIGNTAFIFPVGDDGHYRKLTLSGLTDPASAFAVQYFNDSTFIAIGDSTDAALDHVSDCEYWEINRTNGTEIPDITLSWENTVSCGVDIPAELRVAHWNGMKWVNMGAQNQVDSTTYGELQDTVITSFSLVNSYWTLASTTANNPLPIELLSFTAVPRDGVVDLAWSTASEQNNDHFTVERSADAQHFEDVLQMPGAGNSQQVLHYSATDNAPLAGHSYYRLRQTDYNGNSVVSEMVPVLLQGGADLTVLYDGGRPWLRHPFPAGSVLEVRDGTGRKVAQGVVRDSGLLALPVDGLAHGVYVLRLSDGARVASTRFVY